jgi:hypothetical protein
MSEKSRPWRLAGCVASPRGPRLRRQERTAGRATRRGPRFRNTLPREYTSEAPAPRRFSPLTDDYAPWSIGGHIGWRPQISFFDRRTAILSELDKAGLQRAFRFGDDSIGVLLPAEFHEVVVAAEHAQFHVSTRSIDQDQLQRALEIVIRVVQPAVRGMIVHLQHLVPMSGHYEKLCREAAKTFLGAHVDDLRLHDFALLVDGRFDGGAYQAEFGIVKEDEILPRLSRAVGRMSGPTTFGEEGWKGVPLPELALFVDSTWTILAEEDIRAPEEWVSISLEAAADRARELVESLRAKVEGHEGRGKSRTRRPEGTP